MTVFAKLIVCSIAIAGGETIDHDFRDSQFNLDWLEYEGRGAMGSVKPASAGLHIMMPPPPGARDWIFGVRPRVRPSGDFTITAEFRIDSWEQPTEAQSIGVVIYIVEESNEEAASIAFRWPQKSDKQFAAHKVDVDSGRRRHSSKYFPGNGDRVALRLQREGSELHYYVRRERSYEFELLGTRPFAGGDVRKIRIGAQNSKSREEMEATLESIFIEADELRGLYRGEPGGHRWWLWILIAAVALAVVVGAAFALRRRDGM